MSTLHITNGSHAGDKLTTFADGPVVITADVLHEGPAPMVGDEAWYATRAAFLADGQGDEDAIRDHLAAADRTIGEARDRGDELVLWFEHDLFDQLQLIRNLERIGAGPRDARGSLVGRASLICIDRFPGVTPFIGLGQLTPDQLATLYPSRTPIAADQLALAADAWTAFRSPDPRPLVAMAARLKGDAHAALPFLGDALLRFLADYPSAANGLSLTEERALGALARAPLDGEALFVRAQASEARPFMGDSTFFSILDALAAAPMPLVAIDGPPDRVEQRRSHRFALTDAGHDVLAGRRDHVALNGIDRWRGGVHLEARERTPWRWDARRETLVS